ncbi:MAG: DUF1552 domain-containing protein [Myxococcales bacterium]|nr:DUF1552 domain-containing protein [Myxococcales bacterium]MCB9525902.1 DUF1552 domain-containing protein [Myxococcales bacterium]
MIVKRPPMSRRAVLKGLAATVALPPLEAMLNTHGTAWADGEALPTRFGVWFWGNGVRRQHWIPNGEGAGWQPGAELAPLQGVKGWVSPVTGLEIKTATHPHHSGMAGILTGARYQQVGETRDTIVTTFAHPSVDMLAAAHFEGQTPFRSLELGIARQTGSDEGTSFLHLSHNGPNNVNPSEENPQAVYRRLFGMAQDTRVDLARRSVLDGVMGRIRRLQGRVGATDRARLEQHFESVRALERRLAAEAPECLPPDDPGTFPPVEGREQLAANNRAMSELLALGLACDLTRAFSVKFCSAGSGVIVHPAGARNGLHQMCHDEPAPQPTVHAAVTFIMEQLAVCLQVLRDTPAGAGNLLDHCSILCTTELSEGNVHSNDEFPILIAGKGSGRLRGGIHYRDRGRANTSHAVLTALRGAGVPAASFGHGPGRVDTGIGALET